MDIKQFTMKNKSLAIKLFLITGLLLFISILIITTLETTSLEKTATRIHNESTSQINREIIHAIQTQVGKSAVELASFINQSFKAPITLSKQLSSSITSKHPLSRSQIVTLDRATLAANPHLSSVYSQFEANAYDGQDAKFTHGFKHSVEGTGTFEVYFTRNNNDQLEQHQVASSQEKHTTQLNINGIPEAQWYLCPMKTLKPCMSEPYLYEIKPGNPVLLASLTVPIIANGTFRGVTGSDVNFPAFQKQIEQLSQSLYKGRANVLLLSKMGLIVASSHHPDQLGKKIDQVIPELAHKWKNLDRTSFTENNRHIMLSYPVHLQSTDTHWTLLVDVPKKVAFADVINLNRSISQSFKNLLTKQIITGTSIIIIGLILMWLLIRTISKPLKHLNERMINLNGADGDLTQIVSVNSHQELISLARSFNQFLSKIKTIIHQSKHVSIDVSKQAQNSVDTASQTRILVDRQQHEIDSVVTAIQEMSATAAEIGQFAEQAADGANHANQSLTDSQEILHHAVDHVQSLAQDMETAAKAIGQVENRSNDIHHILEVIRSIAEQTNLLALNAAIEAARAGESGRGFAVVADEVRTLAEKTRRSTDEISEVIEKLNSEVGTSVSVIDQGVERASKTVSRANHAYETLENIVSQIKIINDQVTQMAVSAQEQSAVSDEITRNITDIGDAATELTGLAGQTENAGKKLHQQVQHLNQELSRLKTE
ncbi:MAG: Methyl-accepting chemotaxis protein McpU [Candidatus Celerinatantimonas neptuna]|nr:MAG: Methyl-accepting chemotaxis protein McpU [Candidatus Celerinatantimonas neptuna]